MSCVAACSNHQLGWPVRTQSHSTFKFNSCHTVKRISVWCSCIFTGGMRAASRIRGTMGNNVQKEMYQRATKWRDETICNELRQRTAPATHCILSHPSIWWLSGTSPSVVYCPSLRESSKPRRQCSDSTIASRMALFLPLTDKTLPKKRPNGQRRHYGETSVWSWLPFSILTQPSRRCMP